MAGFDLGAGIGSLVGGVGGMLGYGDQHGEDQYKEAVKVLKALKSPDFDMRSITPEQLQLVGEYFPEQYNAVIESGAAVPEYSQEGRQAQLQALQHLAGYTGQDLPLAERLAAQEASRSIGQSVQGNVQAGTEALASRGRYGGGQAAALRAGADQGSMELAGGLGRSMMQEAIRARLQALSQGADISGAMRGQDIAEGQGKADALNRFNEWVSGLKTQVAGANAAATQDSRNRTLSERQRLADTNAQNRQQMGMYNQQNQNQWRQQGYQNELNRGSALAGAYQGYGQDLNRLTDQRQNQLFRAAYGAGGLIGSGAGLL